MDCVNRVEQRQFNKQHLLRWVIEFKHDVVPPTTITKPIALCPPPHVETGSSTKCCIETISCFIMYDPSVLYGDTTTTDQHKWRHIGATSGGSPTCADTTRCFGLRSSWPAIFEKIGRKTLLLVRDKKQIWRSDVEGGGGSARRHPLGL